MATLTTTRYVPPGSYIGQIITPSGGTVPGNIRIPNYIGQGSRLAQSTDAAVRRSFVSEETLDFSDTSPYIATLAFISDGEQDAPVRLFKQDGTEVRADKWLFQENGQSELKEVVINDETFDQTATYMIDYQSTERTVLDAFPVADMREIINIGNVPGETDFIEFNDFRVVTVLSTSVRDAGNTVTSATASTVVDTGNTGTGSLEVNTFSTHLYSRHYRFEVDSAAGTQGNFTATLFWSSEAISGGATDDFRNPVDSSMDLVVSQGNELNLDESSTPTFENVVIEDGITVTFAFGASNFDSGTPDVFEFTSKAPPFIEPDPRNSNSNDFLTLGAFSAVAAGDGTVSHGSDSNYSGVSNLGMKFECTASAGSSGTFSATIAFGAKGDSKGTSTLSLVETVPASFNDVATTAGLTFSFAFGATNFTVGDTFTVDISAPRIYYRGKDDRNYTITIATAVEDSTTPGTGSITGSYLTDTPEGGFGTIAAVLFDSNDYAPAGRLTLPDNVVLMFRNMTGHLVDAAVDNLYEAADKFTFTATNSDVMDWGLNTLVTESFPITSFLVDTNGTVTGTTGVSYLELANIPVDLASITITDTNGDVAFNWVVGTKFIYFGTTPTLTLTVVYQHIGKEPTPGQLYFVTSTHLRPDAFYNAPQRVLSREEGQRLLAPATPNNHLYIMNEIAWDQNPKAVSFTQVKDADDDGTFSLTDFSNALNSTKEIPWITDRTVLSRFAAWGAELGINVTQNDPFTKRESMDYFGAPIGTLIGDTTTIDTLVFLATKTLKVFGSSPAHGTRTLLAPASATRDVLMSDGVEQEVTLDGSFVAGATAAKVASFESPSSTLLRSTLAGFKTIQTYSETENILLGTAQVLYLSNLGAGVFRFEEDTTVDPTADEYRHISAMTQKQNVTKKVRTILDDAVIALVVPTPAAAIEIIRSTLVNTLISFVNSGEVAPYQDDAGNPRGLNPGTDVIVLRDTTDRTKFNFFYVYFLQYPIKRLFGLFQVDSNSLGFSVDQVSA